MSGQTMSNILIDHCFCQARYSNLFKVILGAVQALYSTTITTTTTTATTATTTTAAATTATTATTSDDTTAATTTIITWQAKIYSLIR